MFEFGKNISIGLDIGTSSIKMVEITVKDKKACLTNYAWAPIEGLAKKNENDSSFFELALPKYIKKILSEARFKGKNTHISIPAFGGLITLIDFPNMPKQDIEQAIKFEAHKYIPISLDEVAISWNVIGEEEKEDETPAIKNSAGQLASGGAEDGKMRVLLVAASKNKVVKYENLVKNAGLSLKSIEIEVFSIVNSLIGNDQGTFVILDIGSRVCNIILISKGIIIGNRNIDCGGRDITRTIAKSMGIEEERAETLKTSNKNFFSQESSISFPTLDVIVGEINRLIEASLRKNLISKIDAVVLSGGSAKLTGLSDYLSNVLKIKTIIGNSLSRVSYDKKIQPVIENLQTRFSVCIGLALKGADKYINKN